MEKVAVIILNWNGANMLRRFLPGVLQHTNATVYVADNASTDESLQLLATEFPQVPIIQFPKNLGFAEGYNEAIKKVEAEYVVLLNSDVEVKDDWLAPLVQYMDVHTDVAASQPKILSWYAPHLFEYAGACGGYLDYLGYPFCRGRIFGTLEEDKGQYDSVVPVFWATGAALMVRKDVYEEVGGFDARFFAHMEEIDFCWRLRSRGYGIVCVPTSKVYHVGGGTLPKENPFKTHLNFRNNLYMLYKNLPDQSLKSVMCMRYWLDLLAALQFTLKGEWRSARAVFKAHTEFRKNKHQFDVDRSENIARTKCKQIKELVPYSILWAYYAKGKKHFSRLPQ